MDLRLKLGEPLDKLPKGGQPRRPAGVTPYRRRECLAWR